MSALYLQKQHSAKACGRWAWKNRHNFGNSTKVLSFTTETPQERMSKGANYTNAIRVDKAIKTLQKAAVALRSSGTLVTPLALGSRMQTSLVLDALTMALWRRRAHPDLSQKHCTTHGQRQ